MRQSSRQRARPHDDEDVAWAMLAWGGTRTAGDRPYWVIVVLGTGLVYLWTHVVWTPVALLILAGSLWFAVPSLRRWSAARVRTRRADRIFARIVRHLPALSDRAGHFPRVAASAPFPYGTQLELLLPHGVTPDDVGRRVDELAHGWGAETGQAVFWARVQARSTSTGECGISIFTSDPLAPRSSPAGPRRPYEVGVLETGEPLLFEPVASPHLAVVGDTGSGKSTALRALLAALPSDWIVGLYDPKCVEFGTWPVAGRVVSVASDPADIAHALGQWVAALDMRLSHMAAAGVQHYSGLPGCRPALVVIDEAAVILGASGPDRGVAVAARAALERLVLQGRAAGISVALGYQRPDASLTGGIVRDSVAGRLGLGWLSPDGAAMAYGDPQVAAMFRGEPGVGVVWRVGPGTREPVRCRIHEVSVEEAQRALGCDMDAGGSPPVVRPALGPGAAS
jgi:hypothetical protein